MQANTWQKSQSSASLTTVLGGLIFHLTPDMVFAFHDDEEIGPVMLGKIAKRAGLRPEDL